MSIVFIALSVLLLGAGILFSFDIGFLRLHPKRIIKNAFSNSGREAFKAFCLSLGGIMGAGNIAGIALAVNRAGAGCVLWMLLSALICSSVKYREIFTALKYKAASEKKRDFGPLFYMSRIKAFEHMPELFCLLCAAASFTTGNMVQANALSEQLALSPVLRLTCAVTFTFVFTLFSSCLKNGAMRFSAAAVPLMTVLYLLGCTCILFVNISRIPAAICEIIGGAFGIRQGVYGGLAGILVSARYGISIGLLSHEAGLGTAPIAHCEAKGAKAEISASLGILEVYADTFLGAFFTALCIIVTRTKSAAQAFGSVFGKYGEVFVTVSLALFALSSCISWHFYGVRAVKRLNNSKGIHVYTFIFCAVMLLSFFISARRAYLLSDVTNALMAMTNITALLMIRREKFFFSSLN